MRGAIVVLLLLLGSTIARADNVNSLISSLNNGGDRERLAAAVNLVKLGDPKAILPLVKAVLEKNESYEDVRRVAAAGLPSLISSSTSSSIKGLVKKNLEDAAANDSSKAVRDAASESLGALGGTAPQQSNATAQQTSNAKAVYVNVGPMSSKTSSSNNAKIMKSMNAIATKTVAKTAYATTWQGGKTPSANDLSAKQTAGFYVDGTLNDLDTKISGSSATVSCKVSMLLAEFPSKSMFGFLNGKASVQSGSSQKDIDLAAEDCVQAVVENLITKQIIPTIKTKSGVNP